MGVKNTLNRLKSYGGGRGRRRVRPKLTSSKVMQKKMKKILDSHELAKEEVDGLSKELIDTSGDFLQDLADSVRSRYPGLDVPNDGHFRDPFMDRLGRLRQDNIRYRLRRTSSTKVTPGRIPASSLEIGLKEVMSSESRPGPPKGYSPPEDLIPGVRSGKGGGSVDYALIIEEGSSTLRSSGQTYTNIEGEKFRDASGFFIFDRILKDEEKKLNQRIRDQTRELVNETLDDIKRRIAERNKGA